MSLGRLLRFPAIARVVLVLIPLGCGHSGGSKPGASGGAGEAGAAAGGSDAQGGAGATPSGGAGGGEGVTPLEFRQLALGTEHGCGIDAEGSIQCWGDDFVNEFDQATPPSGSFQELSALLSTTCALRESGAFT